MTTPHLNLAPATPPVRRTEPLGFVLAAMVRAAELAIEDVQTLVARNDVRTLPPHTRGEVRRMLVSIAETAARLAERLDDGE
jgi:hypothetical protein